MTSNRRVDFEAIKAAADFGLVVAHYEARGELRLAKGARGGQLKAHCPWHDDAKPSLSLNLGKKLFHCFNQGECGVSGNALDFVHQLEAQMGRPCSLREAASLLAEIGGVKLDGAEGRPEPRRTSKTKSTAKSASSGQKRTVRASVASEVGSGNEIEANVPLGAEFLARFQASLTLDHPYFAERGLDRAAVKRFGLGFQSKGAWKDRVVIPINDQAGQILAYAGRWALGDETIPDGSGKYKLPKREHFRPDLALYGLDRVVKCRHLTVVEGYFGAIRLECLGLPAVALMGNSISVAQVGLLKALPRLEAITVMLDGGANGQTATDRLLGAIARSAPRFSVRVVDLPDDAQPDTVDRSFLVDCYPSLPHSFGKLA